jgi:hypothetical protein
MTPAINAARKVQRTGTLLSWDCFRLTPHTAKG